MGSLNGIIETTEGVGGVFFWLLVFFTSCWLVWRFLSRLRNPGHQSHFSLLEVVGEIIILGLFVLPSIAVGAYLGSLIDAGLAIDNGLNCLFSLLGLGVGIYIWRRIGTL